VSDPEIGVILVVFPVGHLFLGGDIETTSSKPIPGSKGINPRDLLKSDSELDWQVGKLNEKFKNLIRK
jgi:hypothetical protein